MDEFKGKFTEKLDEILADTVTSGWGKVALFTFLIILAAIIIFVWITFGAWIWMLIWNWLAVAAFGLPAVTYLQAVAGFVGASVLRNIFSGKK